MPEAAKNGAASPETAEKPAETQDPENTIGSKRPDALTGCADLPLREAQGFENTTEVKRPDALTGMVFHAMGALSASFVPVFSRTLSADGRDSARKLANEALTVLIFGCSFVVAVGLIFAPVFVDIMAPGFASHERALAISLTRIMFPCLMC